MEQNPAVGCLVLPPNVVRIPPEQLHLSICIPGVPHGVPQALPRARPRVDQLQLDPFPSCSCEGRVHPVVLRVLLPHHRVELAVVLVAEHKPHIVVVGVCVDKEGSFEVNTPKLVLSDGEAGIRVQHLTDFCSFVEDLPIRITL